jgi:hypothetical protein
VAATDPAYEEQKLTELTECFQKRGRSLLLHKLDDGRWVAFYPRNGQPLAVGPNEEGPSRLDAALAAWSAFMDGHR